jgi:hypothetical protein
MFKCHLLVLDKLLVKAQTQTNHLIGQYKKEGGIKSILPFVISVPHCKQKIQNLFGLELVCHMSQFPQLQHTFARARDSGTKILKIRASGLEI